MYNKYCNFISSLFVFSVLVLYAIFGIGCSNKKHLVKLSSEICPLVNDINYKFINDEDVTNLSLPNDLIKKFNIKFTPNNKVESKYGEVPCATYKLKNETLDMKEFVLVESVEDEIGIDGEPIKHTLAATVFKKIKTYEKIISDSVIDTKEISVYELEPMEVLVDKNNNILNTRDPIVIEQYEKKQEEYDTLLNKLGTLKINNIKYTDGDLVNIDGFTFLIKITNNNYSIHYFNINMNITTGRVGLNIRNKFNSNKYKSIGNLYLDAIELPVKKQLKLEDIPNYEEW